MATYNGEKYIYSQVNSILRQLEDNDEIIVSDDHSLDKTVSIIESFNDARISIYFNQNTKGYSGNFENALRFARGQYVFLSDQDDIWLEGKVEKCLSCLKKYDFIVSDASIVDQNLEILHRSFFSMRKPYKSLIGNLVKFGYIGCCFAFNKNVLNKALPFPKKHSHDNWIFLIACAFFKIIILKEQLVLYRRHTSNASTGGFFTTNNIFYQIKYRIRLVFFLIKRSCRK
jgi:glycosyltransferase involved in cell wall biosynthesis